MSDFWDAWYHCIATFYGNWLRGDERGWRARHHREHVEGDYKDPPPEGMYEEELELSTELRAHDAVELDPRQRDVICEQLFGAMKFSKVEVKDLGVDRRHYHVLARFPRIDVPPRNKLEDERNPVPRYLLGKVHSWTSNQARKNRIYLQEGGMFAPRPKIIPVESDSHFRNVIRYIKDHVDEGAAVWSVMRKK